MLHLAIVLSLLRTELNLNNYINDLYNINSSPVDHEILLGPISGYTQTSNIHNQVWNNFDGTYSHPKSIDSYYSSSVFEDLHSLGHYRRFDGINTNVDIWLVSNPVPPLPSENANTNDVAQPNNGDNSQQSQQEGSSGPMGAVSREHDPSHGALHFPGGELTKEVAFHQWFIISKFHFVSLLALYYYLICMLYRVVLHCHMDINGLKLQRIQ